jgi:YVTN family beta-propeller protein
VINGATYNVIASIGVGSFRFGAAFDSANGYIYVANDNSNNVSVINGATNKVIASIGVGCDPDGAAFDSANGYIYVTNFGSGTVSIISTPSQVMKQYSVTFTESGLPSGTSWYVNLSNGQSFSSTTNIITFKEPNGTYSFSIAAINGYSVSPSSGSITVKGTNISQNITFTSVTTTSYTIIFTETGLPSGISWSVTLNGTTKSSTSSSITFSVPNGTYSYTIRSVSGYTVSPSSGSITVNGKNVNQAITFTPVTTSLYTITYTETGLPSGTSWSVTLNGTTKSSTTDTITFSVPNGTYSYTIGAVSGYTVSNSNGSVTVSGKNIPVSITFSSTSPTAKQPSSGIPSIELYGIIGAVVAVAAIGSAVALIRKRR